jgi:membrane fusion protein
MVDEENKENKESEENKSSQDTPLFREEALQHKKGNYFGKTLIVTPISFSAWSFGLFFIAVAVGLFLYFGEYAKRQDVQGMLVPDKGLITVRARSPGAVAKKFVQQGEIVKKGQLLYLISTEHEGLSEQGHSAQQVELLEKQIEVQKNKISMFEKNANAYEDLLKKHYISELEYQKRQDEYLSAKLSLHEYEKALNQAKEGIDYAVRAPEEGRISALVATVGDHVSAETTLVSIIPEDSTLEGVLFVPTSKSGFVKLGQKVLLKYEAFPYQQFGIYESTIERVDKSILIPQDVKSIPIKIEEPFYRVIVSLQKQTVMVYGKPQQLTTGMLFNAVILGDKRSIWQWVMEPIYSLKGTLES